MAHIRSTIDLLVKILNSNGTSNLNAETFRLAKFNRTEAVIPLWHLLFELVCYCKYGKVDEFVLEAYNQLSAEEIATYVKQELQNKGYYSVDFLQLSNDMLSGSRELLLAFGWLLANDQVIDKFALNAANVLDDDTAGIHKNEMMNHNLNSCLNLLNSPSDIYSRIRQLLWLNNKLRLNLCSLHSMQCQQLQLKHKIHEASVGVKVVNDRHHLSMLEIYLIRNPELMRKNIDLLEKDNKRLHDLLIWQDHEGIFWKWMESILEAKVQDPDQPLPSQISTSGVENMMLFASSRLKESHQTLYEAIATYESVVENLEHLYAQKCSEVSAERTDEIMSRTELELSIQKANISLNGQKNIPKLINHDWMWVEPKFILEKKEKSKYQKTDLQASCRESQPSITLLSKGQTYNTTKGIDDETECLHQQMLLLEKELCDKQKYLKTEIENLSEKLTDAVCIPPLNRDVNFGARM